MTRALRPAVRRGGLLLGVLLFAIVGTVADASQARDVTVAVAANFVTPAREIGARFEAATGHTVRFALGSTGQLYAQIAQSAPFDVFLAADQARPALAVSDGLAVAESRITYATGRLVLFTIEAERRVGETTLREGAFEKLAIANPAIAPYGAAAVQVITALGVLDALEPKIVRGNSVGQAFQFVETGNAEYGFVALAQLAGRDTGSHWLVPEAMHEPIAQDAVLLARSADNQAARAFMAFLMGPEASAIKEAYGYSAAR